MQEEKRLKSWIRKSKFLFWDLNKEKNHFVNEMIFFFILNIFKDRVL